MILFFYGEDNYRLSQKIKELKEKYISASLGDTNLAVLDGKSANYAEIMRQILAFPFLAKSRLVIIKNILTQGKKEVQEQIMDGLKKVPETTVLVFAEEGKPDKRTALYKKLAKEKSQEFNPLEEIEVKKWIKSEVENRNAKINPLATEKLYEFVGNDLWRLSNEIDKLITYDKQITHENIELLVKSRAESDVFALIDALASKNHKQALKELYRLLNAGENELYILSMIVYQYRNLLVVRDFVDRGVANQWDLAKQAGLHPYVAGKTLNLVRNYTLESLKKIDGVLLESDIAMKTGKVEPRTALDLLIARLC